jgi:hypothetical protein
MNEAASRCLIFYFVSLSSGMEGRAVLTLRTALRGSARSNLFEEQAIERGLTSTILERNHIE